MGEGDKEGGSRGNRKGSSKGDSGGRQQERAAQMVMGDCDRLAWWQRWHKAMGYKKGGKRETDRERRKCP